MRFALLAFSLLLQQAIQPPLPMMQMAGQPAIQHFSTPTHSSGSTAYPAVAVKLSADSVLKGPAQAQAAFGESLASAGDVNGDGYSDVLVGAPLFDGAYQDEGRVYVYYGSANGLPVTASLTLSYHCNKGGKEHFGSAVAGAGDINEDGYSDIIIGASEAGSSWNHAGTGQVLVYYGSPAGIKSKADKILPGEMPGSGFGTAAAGAGDINADGYSDIIVGAPGYGSSTSAKGKGRAYIYYGTAAGLAGTAGTYVQGTQPDEQFGKIVAGAGDVNGDGYSDVVVSAPGFRVYAPGDGAVFVYNGSGNGLHTYGVSFLNAQTGWSTGFGQWIAAGTDINGDGHPDLVISQPGYKTQTAKNPRLLIYYGTAQGFRLIPVTIDSTAQNGVAIAGPVAAAGDANGDNYADITVAGRVRNKITGATTNKLLLYHGQRTGLTDIAFTVIDDPGSMATTLSAAGDVNGDGLADIIAANTSDNKAYLYHGKEDTMQYAPPGVTLQSPDISIIGFGKALAYAGDINGDGYSDVIIGDPNAIKGSNNYRGTAYVYYGAANGLPAFPKDSLLDNQANCHFGWSVEGAGDINGDGYADVIISAAYYDGDQGRVFVYYGSPAGLSKTPALLTTSQAGAYLGFALAGGGDLNGDGYSDVLASAHTGIVGGDTSEVWVYYGSPTGLTATPALVLTAPHEMGLTDYGSFMSDAGDVNGDGFSDVVIGARGAVDNGNGRAFVYLGSASGLSPVPATILGLPGFPALPNAYVANAGDVNGDGFSDVLVSTTGQGPYSSFGTYSIYQGSINGILTTPLYTFTSSELYFNRPKAAGDVNSDGYGDIIVGAATESRDQEMVFIYKGASNGLQPKPDTLRDISQAFTTGYGSNVNTAGDVNGDGYADVLVTEEEGGWSYFGISFLYYGNGDKNIRNNFRLYNTDLSTPLSQANLANTNIGAGLFAKSPLGKQKGRLVWETSESGNPFTGSPVTNSTAFTGRQTVFSPLGLAGTELKNLVAKTNKVTHIRARVEYDLTTALTGQHYGPWRYPLSEGRSPIKPAPDPLDILTFSAEKKYKDVLLKWTVACKPGIAYTVERSTGNNHFVALYKTNSRPNATEYRWLDEHPQWGKNYYRIKASSGKQQKYSKTLLVEFGKPAVCMVYPNPVYVGQTLYIRLSPAAGKTMVRLLDNNGREVVQKQVTTDSELFGINIPFVPMGHYKLMIRTTEETIVKDILILRR